MQDSYLTKHSKTPKFPSLHPRKTPKASESALHRLQQPTEQSLMLELQDIDQSLHNKNFKYRHGNLFSSQVTEKLIAQLHGCLKKQAIVMEEGFSLWNLQGGEGQAGQGEGKGEGKRLTNKVQTLNQRMAKLSMQNVYEYDLNKYMQIMKMNKNRWSLFKRTQQQNPPPSTKTPSQITNPKLLETSKKTSLNLHPHSIQSINESISNNTSSMKSNFNFNSNLNSNEKLRESDRTTLSPLSKLSKIVESHGNSRVGIGKEKIRERERRKVLTEISELPNPEDQTLQISKYDIKNMLKKQGDHIIFMWLPPATYPQFNGMFTYTPTRKQSICRLKKYFFFRRSLNPRFFNSILEQISSRQDKYIEGIEIVTNKNDFSKVFEGLGWKMRAIQGVDKVRIRYGRDLE